MYKIFIVLATFASAIDLARADEYSEMAQFAQSICGDIPEGSVTRITIQGKVQANAGVFAKIISGSADVSGSKIEEIYKGIPFEKLPNQIPTVSMCKSELVKILLQRKSSANTSGFFLVSGADFGMLISSLRSKFPKGEYGFYSGTPTYSYWNKLTITNGFDLHVRIFLWDDRVKSADAFWWATQFGNTSSTCKENPYKDELLGYIFVTWGDASASRDDYDNYGHFIGKSYFFRKEGIPIRMFVRGYYENRSCIVGISLNDITSCDHDLLHCQR